MVSTFWSWSHNWLCLSQDINHDLKLEKAEHCLMVLGIVFQRFAALTEKADGQTQWTCAALHSHLW